MKKRGKWVIEMVTTREHFETGETEYPDWTIVGEWFFRGAPESPDMQPSRLDRCVNGVAHWYSLGFNAAGEYIRIRNIETEEVIPAEALGL